MAVATAPATQAIVVTAVHAFASFSAPLTGGVELQNTNCTSDVSFEPISAASNYWGDVATADFVFPTGIAISAGHSLTLQLSGTNALAAQVAVSGYKVPAGRCTASCL